MVENLNLPTCLAIFMRLFSQLFLNAENRISRHFLLLVAHVENEFLFQEVLRLEKLQIGRGDFLVQGLEVLVWQHKTIFVR
jgi:hypothetical protein